MSTARIPPQLRAVLDEVHARCGSQVDDAQLIHHHSNAAVALPASSLLVRVADNPSKLDRVKVSVTVTRWLARRGFPTVEPADLDPFMVDGQVVSLWRLVDVVEDEQGTAADLAELLRELHQQPEPPIPLPELDDPFGSVAAAVEQHPDGMTPQDHAWLLDRIQALRDGWAALNTAQPRGLVHGDAHSNNLMRLRDGRTVLGDWDHVATGPREWDLVQPYYMARRFRRHTGSDLDAFAATYGWDVRAWPTFGLLLQAREITGLSPYVRKAPADAWHRQEVAHRIATIRDGDDTAVWNSPRRS